MKEKSRSEKLKGGQREKENIMKINIMEVFAHFSEILFLC